MSVTIGFLVAVVSNVASAFSTTYGFAAWQSGLCFIAGIVGCLLGTFAGGPFSDWVADYFTQRNNGIREPEMRLPAIIPSVIAAPLALLLYGLGIANQWHWMVPTFGLGLRKISLLQKGKKNPLTPCPGLHTLSEQEFHTDISILQSLLLFHKAQTSRLSIASTVFVLSQLRLQ
jgi:MFS family permease